MLFRSTIVGGMSFIISILWAFLLIVEKLLGGIPVTGWTTLMVMQLFSSGLIMFTLGILGEYIWRSMDAARNRPVYIVDEIVTGEKKTETFEKDIV